MPGLVLVAENTATTRPGAFGMGICLRISKARAAICCFAPVAAPKTMVAKSPNAQIFGALRGNLSNPSGGRIPPGIELAFHRNALHSVRRWLRLTTGE
jgi:hypothetical protein